MNNIFHLVDKGIKNYLLNQIYPLFLWILKYKELLENIQTMLHKNSKINNS